MDSRLGGPDCVLWIPENDLPKSCQWFVKVKPLMRVKNNKESFKKEYWEWNDNNLLGYVRCFSLDIENQEEWWGFTNKEDIVLWMLRWS